MGNLSVDFDKTNLDVSFDKDDPETIIHIRLMGWHNIFKQCKSCKEGISKELIPVAWHPTKW